ncbi:hypothetical protein GYH30_042754 [Glycine max]|nr:hypothetical protein GYH30_042754 [Glycine max]
MQITDFSGRNRRWSLFRSQPTNGHENHVTCRCIVVSEGFSAGRYMAFLPFPSPHLSGLCSTPLSDLDKSFDGTGFDVNGRCSGGVLVDDGLD